MNANQIERAAYIAAHRLLTTDLSASELACPGARRSAILDKMANIIVSVFEAHHDAVLETTAKVGSFYLQILHPEAKPALVLVGARHTPEEWVSR